jgi:hypothetical protein
MKHFAFIFGLAAGMLITLLLPGCATQSPAAKMHVVMTGNPPQYFSGIVTYRNNHVQRLMVGSDRFLSCQEALKDTGPALTKAIEAPDGWAAKGICIPVPTLDVSDLVPQALF